MYVSEFSVEKSRRVQAYPGNQKGAVLMPIGDVFEGWCPCGLTHVRSKLVAEYEEHVSKNDPQPISDEGPSCNFCGEEVVMTLVSPEMEGTR
jgi:hypothetical protein